MLESGIWLDASLQLLRIVELDLSTSPQSRHGIHSILCVEEEREGQTCQIWFQSCGLELGNEKKERTHDVSGMDLAFYMWLEVPTRSGGR
jgi:hypothetical protein